LRALAVGGGTTGRSAIAKAQAPSRAQGPGGSGGGDFACGELLDFYEVKGLKPIDPTKLPGFDEVVKPLLARISKLRPGFDSELKTTLLQKAWLLDPRGLAPGPKDITPTEVANWSRGFFQDEFEVRVNGPLLDPSLEPVGCQGREKISAKAAEKATPLANEAWGRGIAHELVRGLAMKLSPVPSEANIRQLTRTILSPNLTAAGLNENLVALGFWKDGSTRPLLTSKNVKVLYASLVGIQKHVCSIDGDGWRVAYRSPEEALPAVFFIVNFLHHYPEHFVVNYRTSMEDPQSAFPMLFLLHHESNVKKRSVWSNEQMKSVFVYSEPKPDDQTVQGLRVTQAEFCQWADGFMKEAYKQVDREELNRMVQTAEPQLNDPDKYGKSESWIWWHLFFQDYGSHATSVNLGETR
jgi:hypothetical protein